MATNVMKESKRASGGAVYATSLESRPLKLTRLQLTKSASSLRENLTGDMVGEV